MHEISADDVRRAVTPLVEILRQEIRRLESEVARLRRARALPADVTADVRLA